MAEDMRFVPAIGTYISRHVLDQAQNRGLESAEHVDRLACIQQSHILRGRDDQCAGQLGSLAQGQLHIPGAGRQVDDQHVQLAPVHLPQHLLQRPHQHRTAPDDCLVLFHHEADGHHSDAMGVQRFDDLAIGRCGLALGAHHPRLRGTIYIGIQQPHLAPGLGQRHRQVGRHGGFAHPALARSNGQDAIHTCGLGRAGLRRRMTTHLQLRRVLRFRRGLVGGQNARHGFDTGQVAHDRLGGGLHAAHLARHFGRGRLDHEAHGAAVDTQRADEIPADRVAAIRQLQTTQRVTDCVFIYGHFGPPDRSFAPSIWAGRGMPPMQHPKKTWRQLDFLHPQSD